MVDYMLSGSFICNRCRNLCKGPCDGHIQEVLAGHITEENKDLVGRKQRIVCLGKYCENPCSEQDLTQYADVDLTPFLNLIKYLGNKCNELIEENNKKI